MNFRIKILIALLLHVLFLQTFAYAQQNAQVDKNSKIQVRESEKINDYLNDKSFVYSVDNLEYELSLIDKILYKIQKFLLKLFSYKHSETIFYVIVILIFLFVIVKLFGLNYQSVLFKKPGKSQSNIDVFFEDINTINFDELISLHIQNKDYKPAVRYLFLKYLKFLSDNEIIIWEANKTNFDYAKEIKNTKYYQNYKKLSFYFEYIWYGEFPVDNEQFEYTKKQFDKSFNK